MPKTEADLLELMRADRLVLDERLAVQTAVDLEAARGTLPANTDPRQSNPHSGMPPADDAFRCAGRAR